MSISPIGVFDSGLGGLSVFKEIVKLLPNENIIYFADSGNCPYGEKSPEEITNLSTRIVDFLINQGCKIIVIACNTATAAAIHYLRAKYKISFIGIEPATKPAAINSKTGTIGILATKGTFEGKFFKSTKQKYAYDTKVIIEIGTGLVEIVENNDLESEHTHQLVKEYIEPMIAQQADHIVLGCTHYPFLKPIIQQFIPDNVTIVNPAPAVARQTLTILKQNKLNNQGFSSPTYQFYTSGRLDKLQAFLDTHFGELKKLKLDVRRFGNV
jgi:glutamate racemase